MGQDALVVEISTDKLDQTRLANLSTVEAVQRDMPNAPFLTSNFAISAKEFSYDGHILPAAVTQCYHFSDSNFGKQILNASKSIIERSENGVAVLRPFKDWYIEMRRKVPNLHDLIRDLFSHSLAPRYLIDDDSSFPGQPQAAGLGEVILGIVPHNHAKGSQLGIAQAFKQHVEQTTSVHVASMDIDAGEPLSKSTKKRPRAASRDTTHAFRPIRDEITRLKIAIKNANPTSPQYKNLISELCDQGVELVKVAPSSHPGVQVFLDSLIKKNSKVPGHEQHVKESIKNFRQRCNTVKKKPKKAKNGNPDSES